MRNLILCRRWPARLTKTMLSLALLTCVLVSCTPAPKPTPQVRLGGTELHFPLAMASPYKWQRTGYGRPWQSIGKDPELHNRGMWAYSWGVGNCMDIPMVFSDKQMPSLTGLQRCAQVSDVLLIFNEPEYPSQAKMTPEIGAQTLRYLESVWPGELWCCGNGVAEYAWFDRMMAAYKAEFGELPRLAGVHMHIYVAGGIPPIDAPADGRWLARSQGNYARYLAVMRRWGVPERVIVSECCLLGKFDSATHVAVMDAYMGWLRSEPAVESVAWFSARYAGFPDANLLRAGGRLTNVGESWIDWRWR